jgi:N-acetylglucosaminyldiphosphoundecaprenol N-acetyl-beta-D-mannosaminyltransferase
MLQDYTIFKNSLNNLTISKKILVATINAHSYNTALADKEFNEALQNSDVLIPDGISVVWAVHWLTRQKLTKIAGADLFFYEMNRLEASYKTQDIKTGKAFFLGSTEEILAKIKARAANEFSHVEVATYSPPYKPEFSEEENEDMITAINAVRPDVLFVGMTAPKQEKWAYQHFNRLEAGHVCCIGAVFDFYAGTVKRAPQWMIKLGLEWMYRLVKEPKRMWRRYLIGNTKFIWSIIKEKYA